MARRRASMREGPLAELFRATEAAQRQKGGEPGPAAVPAPDPDATVESAAPFDEAEPGSRPPVSTRASPSRRRRSDGRPTRARPRAEPGPPGQPRAPIRRPAGLAAHRSPPAG